jgi:two-component system, NtrC family, response regulator AtoC
MRILLVDDERELREGLADLLSEEGHAIVQAGDGGEALASLDDTIDLIICDVRLPDLDGAAVLQGARQRAPLGDFIMMTAFGDVNDAVSALKLGAATYLVKPLDVDELLHHVRSIAADRALRGELIEARRQLARRGAPTRLIGTSAQMRKVAARIDALAPSESSVLITGETGTGKELAALEIHDRSLRAGKPFVAVNCGAFPATLIEAELFGYDRGAFTGAEKAREGRFRVADGGTLFLDEIGELPLPAQAKLLRVLQEGTVEPLGTDKPVQVDVRLISATHRDLRQRISEGLFREDLFYRVNVLDVSLPALREREGDREVLIRYFLREAAKRRGGDSAMVSTLSPEAYDALMSYPFPGNVRELAHAIEHASVLSGGGEIDRDHLPVVIAEAPRLRPQCGVPAVGHRYTLTALKPLAVAIREFEKEHLRTALAATGGKRIQAAKVLGISRKCLWEKLRTHERDAKTAADSGVDAGA